MRRMYLTKRVAVMQAHHSIHVHILETSPWKGICDEEVSEELRDIAKFVCLEAMDH